MKRRVLNFTAALVVLVGSWVCLSPPVVAQSGSSTCTAGNGAQCTGTTCCADAVSCYTSEVICAAMYCDTHPSSPHCQQQPGT